MCQNLKVSELLKSWRCQNLNVSEFLNSWKCQNLKGSEFLKSWRCQNFKVWKIYQTGKCQNLNVSESLVTGRCQKFKISNLNVSEPDSVRILWNQKGSELYQTSKCQNLNLTSSGHKRFWHIQILTLSGSDKNSYLEILTPSGFRTFWHYPVLTISDSDTFRFWHFQILTLSGLEQKMILTLSRFSILFSESNFLTIALIYQLFCSRITVIKLIYDWIAEKIWTGSRHKSCLLWILLARPNFFHPSSRIALIYQLIYRSTLNRLKRRKNERMTKQVTKKWPEAVI